MRATGSGQGVKGAARGGDGQPRAFVIQSRVALGPGETKKLRFAYGFTRMGAPWPLDASVADASRDLLGEARKDLRKHLLTNNNQHAMPMLAALRAAGVHATAAGLRVAARGGRFSLATELLDLTSDEGSLRGVYRPFSERKLTVEAPKGTSIRSAKVVDVDVAVATGATSATLSIVPPSAAFEVALGAP